MADPLHHVHSGSYRHSNARTTVADLSEDNYDVKYVKYDLNLSDTVAYISGSVSTTVQVVSNTGVYTFELNDLYIVDSAKINGQLCYIMSPGNNIRKVVLPAALDPGAIFTAQVFYHGNAPFSGSTSVQFIKGLVHDKTPSGTDVLYSHSEPYGSRDWWPCKQSLTDKIDSVDMYVTTPARVRCGSNGLLVNIDSSRTGFWKHHWQTHYPIDYYLVSIAVGRYIVDTAYVHFTGSNDSMLIQNFFLDTATFYPAYKKRIDSTRLMIDYYSTLFGRYPFWKEKYGVCHSTILGAMENQTMTTLNPDADVLTIAHELCHQWFGDHVTCATWRDIWLNEGLASYGEILFANHFWNAAAAKAVHKSYYNAALTATSSIYVSDTLTHNVLFDPYGVYWKGSCIINTLRSIAPQDSLFFTGLKTYQQTHRFGNASTTDLKAIFENVYNKDLDTFFNQWIYGRGFPRYAITWNQIGSSVFVKLVQTTSAPTFTPLFSTPLELQLHSASADTIVRVYNNKETQVYSFNWAQQLDTIGLEPNLLVLCRVNGAVQRDNALGIANTIVSKKVQVFPNPSENYWQITDLPEHAQLVLVNMDGRTVWTGESDSETTTVPAAHLAPGNYVLKLKGNYENYEGVILTRY